MDVVNRGTHKEIIAKLDYWGPILSWMWKVKLKKYDFQKPSKIPYLETTGMPTRILLKKRRFKCYHCSKMMVRPRPLLVKKKSPNSSYHQPKDCSKADWKDFFWPILLISVHFNFKLLFASSMTFTLSMIFLAFHRLCPGDEYTFTKGKMSFIAQDFDNLISSLFLRNEHKLSSEITFFDTIEPFVVRWKSLLWICLVPTMT